MPPATRSRSQSQTAPYPTAGSSSRAANAQQTANTSRGTRATRSRSGSMISNGTVEGGERRVTRSQAKIPAPGRQRLTQVMEQVMEEVTQEQMDSDQGESEVEEDGTAVTIARRMEVRRSLVPGPGDNAGRPDTRLIFAPLTIEERAQRLYRDSGIVLQAVLERRGEGEGPFDMAMNAKWKNWEGEMHRSETDRTIQLLILVSSSSCARIHLLQRKTSTLSPKGLAVKSGRL